MGTKYSFGWSESCAVEIPELEAFMTMFRALCEQAGIGFELHGGYEDSAHLEIVPFAGAEFDFFINLDEYHRGVPWLDAAKDRYEQNRADEATKKRQTDALKEAQAAEAREKKRKAEVETALRDGIILDGKHYKLTETR